MIRLFTILLFSFSFFPTYGQTIGFNLIDSKNSGSKSVGLFVSDSVNNMKLFDTATSKLAFPGYLKNRLARQNGRVYWNPTGTKFILLDSVTGGGSTIDTTSLSNRINQKVGYVDTAAMLSPYATKVNLKDTATVLRGLISSSVVDTTSLSNRINQRVKYTDTTAMLAPYATKAKILIDSIALISAINQRVKYSDTASMLASYGSAIASKLSYTDTAAMLANYINSASNGLTKTGKNVALGGALTGATTITTTGVNTLALAGLQSGGATDSVVTVNPSTGVIARRAFPSAGASGWSLTGNSGTNSATNFIGTTDNQGLTFRTNNNARAFLNVLGGFYAGEGANTTLTGIAMGYFADAGDHAIALGRNSFSASYSFAAGGISSRAEQIHAVAIGSNARAMHVGSLVMSSRKSGADVSSVGDNKAIISYDEWRQRNGNNDTTYININAQGIAVNGNTPIATGGTGLGTGGTLTVSGTLNNYKVTATIGTAPTGGGIIATISGFPTYSVAMAPVWSGNATTEALSGSQRIGVDGTTNTHVITAGSVPPVSGTTYIINIICLPKL